MVSPDHHMAKATFIGDPKSDQNPAACEMFGMIFPRGQPVEVTDEKTLAKLAGNSHFEVGAKAAPKRQAKDKDVNDGANQE